MLTSRNAPGYFQITGNNGKTLDITQDGKLPVEVSIDSVTATDVTIKDATNETQKLKVNADGSIPVQLTGRIVKDYFSGNSTTTRSGFGTGKGFSITNDGNADLTFTIGSITITVKPGEVFDGEFADFTSVTVTTTVAFRAIVRG